MIEPAILDLNDVVTQTRRLLGRLLGEDITITMALAPALPHVKADPAQIDQVLMNLCVNARDAMPSGGQLTIETRAVVLEEGQTDYPDLAAGRYAMLSVADNGCGMTDDTKAQIFEPFFTTKEPGKGTGLGLATVFGIVKQSSGCIGVASEVGSGTTFTILLPGVDAALSRVAGGPPDGPLGGTETVLLVEDEVAVRKIARMALEARGYRVLEAAGGPEAIALAGRHDGPIHLLLTDVVMPHVSGRHLADTLRSLRSGLRVLYMSGHTDDAVLLHGVLAHADSFVQKPFSLLGLVRKVREVLDGPKSGPAASCAPEPAQPARVAEG